VGNVPGRRPGVVEAPDQHGFVLLGEQVIFGAHLAMFHVPAHQYQVVLRLTLGTDAKGADARQKFLDARRVNPTTPFIVVNSEDSRMVLAELLRERRFPAEIWTLPGNDFNRKRTLATGLTVTIEQIVYARRFVSADPYPARPRYLIFGQGGTAHLVHCMTKHPDYQLIADLAEVPSGLPIKELAAGLLVDLGRIGDDHCPTGDPLAPYRGRDVTAVEIVDIESGMPPQDTRRLTLRIGATRWFDVKYLNMPGENEADSFSGYLASAAV
jgi:hypothetical protein